MLNDNGSTITNSLGASGLMMGVVAGKNVDILNDNASTMTGAVVIGSTSGSVKLTNDNGSTWTSDGISVLGALGADQDVTVDNKDGSAIAVTNGLLTTLADRNATINNSSEEFGARSSITFGGVSANVMFADDGDAIISNDRSDFTFDGAFTGNFMIAGRDTKIENKNEGRVNFNSAINGNFMFADQDALIENTADSTMVFAGRQTATT